MLHEFLSTHRPELIERCRTKVAVRAAGQPERELMFGVTPFLEQLIITLQLEQGPEPELGIQVSGQSSGLPSFSEMGTSAAKHGRELLEHGFSVQDVVHDYGDLCQSVSDLAFELDAPISTDEFRTLNRCLDNAIAVAVTEYAYQRDSAVAEQNVNDLNVKLGTFAHELRNQLTTAVLAVAALKKGTVGMSGATGAVLERSLVRLGNLIDNSLSEVRHVAGMVPQERLFSLAGFVAELKATASLEAGLNNCPLTVAIVDHGLALSGDRDLLLAAAGNLLQNAFKFTAPGGEVQLNAYADADRILIDVEDRCGGLHLEDPECLFKPFFQAGANRSGAGLGLVVARQNVEANKGLLTLRDVPGTGCVFTISLPRHLLQEPVSSDRLILR